MAQSLSKHAGEVIYVGPYSPKILLFILKALKKTIQIIFRKNYNITYSYILSMAYKYYFTPRIKRANPDVVFAASASVEMSQLKLNCPIVYLGDATFNLLNGTYSNFSNLVGFSRWESELIENKTYKNSAAVVFSSTWATNSAINDYKVSPEKIHLIPYGANLKAIPKPEELIHKSISSKIKLLFLGLDWERKGGDIVYLSFLELQKKGVNVELTICGCIPPKHVQHTEIKVIPFLNKNNDTDFKVLYNLLLESHFLFVPSRSDCTPIVFCEANAFGIPVITSEVGGIPSVIKNGINGYMLPVDAKPEEFAGLIATFSDGSSDYSKLTRSSRAYFDDTLNWDSWGIALNQILIDAIH